jgi:hypothetical protein
MISYDSESMYKQAQGVKNWATTILLLYAFVGLLVGLSVLNPSSETHIFQSAPIRKSVSNSLGGR